MTGCMAALMNPHRVIARARRDGFHLVHLETDTRQRVWEWHRGGEPKPRFVSRRAAVQWMAEFLERDGGLPFVLNVDEAS
jgi:hypothetical protein